MLKANSATFSLFPYPLPYILLYIRGYHTFTVIKIRRFEIIEMFRYDSIMVL